MELDQLGKYYVNFHEVVKAENYHEETIELARVLLDQPYYTLSAFFQLISDDYLAYLIEIADIEDEDDPRVDELILVTMMLLQAECVEITEHEEILHRIEHFKMMCAGIELGRQGQLTVFYDNLSFGEDMYDKTVFKKN